VLSRITGCGFLLFLLICPVLAQDANDPAGSDDPPVVAGTEEEKEAAKAQDRALPEPETKEPTQEAQDGLEWAIDGYLMADVRYRNASGENDLDFWLHSYVDGWKKTASGTTWAFRFNARLFWRVTSRRQPTDFTFNYWDTFSGALQARFYEVYAQARDLAKGRVDLTVGRMFLQEGVYFHIDGGRVDFKWKKATITLAGGVPVRLSGTSVDSNWMVGLIFRAPVAKRTRIRFSYYHVDESFPGINFPQVDPINQPVSIPPGRVTDDYFGFSVWHYFYTNLPFFARFTLLNGRANELHLRLRWFTKDGKWSVFTEWYQLFERLNNVTNDLSPYVPMMGSFDPFFRLTGRAIWRPNDEWIVNAGLAWRQLSNTSDEGRFNHTYLNYTFTVTRVGLMKDKLDLTLSSVGYNSTRTNDIFVITGSAVYKLSDVVELSGGLDYSLFKYFYFNNTERENVWTFWLRARWKPEKDWRVDGGISVDDDRFTTYTTLYVRVTMRF